MKGIRRLIPSTVLIARNPLFSVVSRLIDGTYGRWAEWITGVRMPPLRQIVRTGVGNNILFPHYYYATAANNMWHYFFSQGFARLDSHIVDIGSGCGKSAAILRDFKYGDARFSGHYYGFDIDREQMEWSSRHFPKDRFTFSTVDGQGIVYPSSGRESKDTSLAVCQDGSIDFVFSQSLVTHLLEKDLDQYFREAYRVLRPGRVMCMTFFCLEDMRDLGLLGTRWSFRHRIGRAVVENMAFPEAAVAYEKDVISDIAKSAGFPTPEVILPACQSSLLCLKPVGAIGLTEKSASSRDDQQAKWRDPAHV